MPLTKDKYFELIDSNSDYPHFRCALGAYIPGSLYKYFSIPDDSDEARKRFEQLKSGEIWFSKRSGLNDPFEFEHIALKGAQNDARQYYLNKQQELEVCCFSALLYNKLMWSHYAAGYKGYCVEFRVESPERFYPVIYENEVPDLSQEYQRFYDMRNEMCANPSLVLNNYENRKVLLRINYPLFSKDTCWSYEEEYRILDSSTVSNKISAHINERDYKNPDNDPRGPYKTMPCTNKGGAIYSVMTPSGKTITEEWRFKRETYDRLLNDNRLVFPRDGDGKPRYKLFLSEKKSEGQLANTWLDFLASNQEATREIKSLFGNSTIFSTPKPVELIKFCMDLATKTDSIVLDFFSGSATTAHAVMQLNAEDGGHRKFIMVQLPEPCDENSEAFKAGYKNICEIGKERIRRAGEKIKEENPLTTQNLDIGFRVFRVDESNMKNVYYHPEEVTQLMLGETVSNIKEDRTDLDLLYACLLDWGVEINLSHTSTQVAGCTVHNVDNGALAACFDKAVPRAVVEYIANLQPLRAVFRDSAFATDAEKINVTEIFKNLSPDTKVKVI